MIKKEEALLETFGLNNEDTIVSSIDKQQIVLFFQIFASSFYSDAIGSIIREITSNCIDANQENNIEEPIKIEFYKDLETEDYILKFNDNGIGLSPERIRNVYMKLFKSTKKDNPNQIGYYGLGSKTPLSYKRESGAKEFHILTRHEGIEYYYLYSFVNSNLPTLDLLYSKNTDLSSGTTIKIDIDNKDYNNVISKLKVQTSYFRNVYIDNVNIDNDFKIYETEWFLYRNKNQYSSTIHIVYGEVPYPIDFNIIGYDYKYELPIGVKFNINEITPTPSRESIEYSDDAIQTIRYKIEQTILEIQELYSKQNSSAKTLDEYYSLSKRGKKLRFSEEDTLNLSNSSFIKDVKVDLFDEIPYVPNNLFFEYGIKKYSSSKKKERMLPDDYPFNMDLIKNSYLINTYLNKYDVENKFKFTNIFYIIKKYKVGYDEYKRKLGFTKDISSKFRTSLVPHTEEDRKCIKREYKAYDEKIKNDYLQLGKSIIIFKYKKLIEDYVNTNSKKFNHLSSESIEELIKEQKRLDKEKRLDNKIVVNYKSLNNYKNQRTIEKLKKSFILFYVMEDEDIHKAKEYEKLLSRLRWSIKNTEEKVKFIILNKTNYVKVKKLENLLHIDNFFNVDNFAPYFNNLRITYKIIKKLKINLHCNIHDRVSPMFSTKYEKVLKFKEKYEFNNLFSLFAKYKKEICLNIKRNNKFNNNNIELDINECNKFLEKTKILNHLSWSIPTEYLVQITKNLKVNKLKEIYYGKCKS